MNPIEKLDPKDIIPPLAKIRDESKLGEEFFGSANAFLSILRQYQNILNNKMVSLGEVVLELYNEWGLYREYQLQLLQPITDREKLIIQKEIENIHQRKQSLLVTLNQKS